MRSGGPVCAQVTGETPYYVIKGGYSQMKGSDSLQQGPSEFMIPGGPYTPPFVL